jgi:hypothetical protein
MQVQAAVFQRKDLLQVYQLEVCQPAQGACEWRTCLLVRAQELLLPSGLINMRLTRKARASAVLFARSSWSGCDGSTCMRNWILYTSDDSHFGVLRVLKVSKIQDSHNFITRAHARRSLACSLAATQLQARH